MSGVIAWSVIDQAGYPLPATVHGTRRGAIANWLGVYGGIMPLIDWDDNRLEAEWLARKRHARVAQVTISVVQ